MKRKLVLVTVIASMLVSGLTGCGSSVQTATSSTTETATTADAAVDTQTTGNDLNIMIETPGNLLIRRLVRMVLLLK